MEPPTTVQAADVPSDFLRQISRPDDQPLRERKVCPHHEERQHPLAVVLHKIWPQHLRHWLVIHQDSFNHNCKAHRGEHLADQDISP